MFVGRLRVETNPFCSEAFDILTSPLYANLPQLTSKISVLCLSPSLCARTLAGYAKPPSLYIYMRFAEGVPRHVGGDWSEAAPGRAHKLIGWECLKEWLVKAA